MKRVLLSAPLGLSTMETSWRSPARPAARVFVLSVRSLWVLRYCVSLRLIRKASALKRLAAVQWTNCAGGAHSLTPSLVSVGGSAPGSVLRAVPAVEEGERSGLPEAGPGRLPEGQRHQWGHKTKSAVSFQFFFLTSSAHHGLFFLFIISLTHHRVCSCPFWLTYWATGRFVLNLTFVCYTILKYLFFFYLHNHRQHFAPHLTWIIFSFAKKMMLYFKV